MAGVLRLCFAVTLLVVACADDGSKPQKSPLGQDINSVAARIEKQCVKKAGMTPEEIKTLEDDMHRLENDKKGEKDFHALRKEISESIRPKWDAFENCVADAAAGEM
ncbi:uncharacterized protein LOC119160067 [Rhipicephalus microplus]|uniref:uncharacterized protein LOC119160067 n=1 Tax=Rhipicephalus microplus TaxID=6941 RepID=UPI003F6C3E2C